MVLLTGYQTPQALRRSGETRLRAWLAKRKVRSSDQIAATALVAAKAQQTVVPGQDVAASIVADLSAQLLATTAAAAGVAADREVLEQILATSHAERSATKPGTTTTPTSHHPYRPSPSAASAFSARPMGRVPGCSRQQPNALAWADEHPAG